VGSPNPGDHPKAAATAFAAQVEGLGKMPTGVARGVLMMQAPLSDFEDAAPIFEVTDDLAREDSYLQEIVEKLNDPAYSAIDVLRLVLAEFARLCLHLRRYEDDSAASRFLSRCRAEGRVLLDLANVLERTERLRKKADVLDLDGPKFRFVLRELVKCFESVIHHNIGKNDSGTERSMLLQLKDLMVEREQDVRRELKNMG
jgi:hypothetical protein